MLTLSWFLARRFLRASTHDSTLSLMALICWISIFIGTASLAIVAAVMTGMETVTHEKMQGIHSDLTISAPGQLLDYSKLQPLLEKTSGLKAFTPRSSTNVIINSKPMNVALLMGIDPARETLVSKLPQFITQPNKQSFISLLNGPAIIIGQNLAQALRVNVGDTLELIYTENTQLDEPLDFERVNVTIAGIFKIGIEEFDAYLLFCNLAFFQSLFANEGVTEVGIKLTSFQQEQSVIQELQKAVPSLSVYSWKALYPALISSLALEKYAMFFVLMLIVLVASMSMLSLLFMLITQKKVTIAIAQATGISLKTIMHAFILFGLCVAISAGATGISFAYIISYLLEHYIHIELPDVYYVSHIPAHMNISIALTVMAVVILLTLAAVFLPIQRMKQFHIADILRLSG